VNHNQHQQIYHQQPLTLTNYNASNATNLQGMNPLTIKQDIKQDNKDYLNVNYAYRGN
jgi:hypothetical protein